MADRIAVLNLGRLQQVGTPRQVYDHPLNLFVAGFVGHPRMNLLDSSLTVDGQSQLHGLDQSWSLLVPDRLRDAIRQAGHEKVILGVRPEDLALETEAQADRLAGQVFVYELLGDRTIVDVRLGEAIVKVRTAPTVSVQAGQPVWLRPNTDRLHLFDASTGLRLADA